MSESSSPIPGPTASSGSQMLSGSTTYTITLSGSFGPTASDGSCLTGTDYVAEATATGTDNVPMMGSGFERWNGN
jgi:hypothetical protein